MMLCDVSRHPKLIVFSNGKKAGRLVGSHDKYQIADLLGPVPA
jgi:hypothetical protein